MSTHPLPMTSLGTLPMGRHHATLQEAENYCALGDTALREALWAEFEQLTNLVRGAVGRVPAAWLSGSFFSAKEKPGDIDVLYLLDRKEIDAVTDPDGRSLLGLLGKGGAVKSALGLRVDAYVLPWWPRVGTNQGTAGERPERYLQSRGYWDDLWCRLRDENTSLAKIPRRGYLEVIIDGYEAT